MKKRYLLFCCLLPLLLTAQRPRLYFPQKLSEGIHKVNISTNGTVVSTFSNAAMEFRFWDVTTGKLISNFPLPNSYNFSWSAQNFCKMVPDGSGMVYYDVSLGSLQFWDRKHQELKKIASAKHGHFSHDGRFLFVKEPDFEDNSGKYIVKGLPLGKWEAPPVARLPVHQEAVLAPLPNDLLQVLIVEPKRDDPTDPEFNYRLSLIDLKESQKKNFDPVFTTMPVIENLMTSRPLAVVNTGEADRAHLKLFDYQRGQWGRDLGVYSSQVVCSVFSPDERYLYTLLREGKVMRQDLSANRPPEELAEVDLYLDERNGIETFTPVLKNTAAGLMCLFKSGENQLETWNIDRGEKIWEQQVSTILRRRGGQLDQILLFQTPGWAPAVLISGKNGNIIVKDLQSGRITRVFEYGYPVATHEAGFSPDGKLMIRSDDMHWSFDLSAGRLTPLSGPPDTTGLRAHFELPEGRPVTINRNVFDYSIQLFDPDQNQLLASLYLLNDKEWVAIHPDGLFDASPGAMNLLYYVVDLEIIELDQLKGRYYEPGLLQKLLGYSQERLRSVEGMDQLPLYPSLTAQVEGEQLKVQLEERKGGIGPVSIFVNGKEVARDANPDRQSNFSFKLAAAHHLLLRHPDSTNIVSLRAFNAAGWLKGPSVELAYHPNRLSRGNDAGGNSAWEDSLDPKMYVVSIGTSDYNGDQLDLKYAAQDALAMAKALHSVGANLFANGDSIEVHCLSTVPAENTGLEGTPIQWEFASKANIETTLKNIRRRAKAEDVLLVYLSGHGLTYGSNGDAQFYYLTHDINSEDMISDPDARARYTVSTEELTNWINDIAALKQVLIIDACNSGKVVESLTSSTRNLNSGQIRALDRMKDRTGMFILSGSAADKVSYEASEYGQGLLTYSLLQGMLGIATRKTAHGDFIDVMKLFQHAADEVPRLAATINGIQSPMLGFPSSGASFDIGIFDEQVDIPVGNKKPVISGLRFLNGETITDDQGIEKRLRIKLMQETEKGKDADLLLVEVNDYPDAYSINGLYTVDTEGNIHPKVNLARQGAPSIQLEVEATDDPERLVKRILRVVKRSLPVADH